MNYSSENSKKYQTDMERVVNLLIRHRITISVMESCTGGFFSSCLTDTEGASAVFLGSFVTYSNEAKVRNGVSAGTIETYGVYSPETALAMAEACRSFYCADIGVGITGSFQNADPDNADSVPGEVFFALLWKDEKIVRRLEFATEGLSRRGMKERIVENVEKELTALLETGLNVG